jgi:hypothetical protein
VVMPPLHPLMSGVGLGVVLLVKFLHNKGALELSGNPILFIYFKGGQSQSQSQSQSQRPIPSSNTFTEYSDSDYKEKKRSTPTPSTLT